jgi:hypothetical protein
MFRFTIRDVLWLTVVIAILCAWGLSYRHWSETNRLLAADRGDWLTRAIYLKAMFKVMDKRDAIDVEWTRDGKTNLKMRQLDRPLLTDRERQLILADESVP